MTSQLSKKAKERTSNMAKLFHNLPGVCRVKTQENPGHNTMAFLLLLMLASATPAWEAQAEEFHQVQGRMGEMHSLKEKTSISVLGNVLQLLVNLLRKKRDQIH